MVLPLISVAMATYNGESYLKEQLESIFSQSYKNIEVVVSDDCSSDSTVDILEYYSRNYNLTYYVNEKNIGFQKNFEKVLTYCKGDYIALADQDDIWESNKLELQLENIDSYSLICSDVSIIDKDKKIVSLSFNKIKNIKIPKLEEHFLSILLNNSFVQGCTILINKDVLKVALPFPETKIAHDMWIGIISSKLNGIKFLDLPLVKYRKHGKNITGLSPKALQNKYYRYLYYFSMKNIWKNRRYLHKYRFKMLCFFRELQKMKIFSIGEKKIINELISMYHSLIYSKSKIGGFRSMYKYRNYIFRDKNRLIRIFKVFWICYF